MVQKFDCNYSRSGIYTLLDRLNIVWITGRSKHPKSSQEAFPEEVEKLKEEIDKDKIEIWWQDESRVGQQGTLSRVWATKGTRPRVVRQKQFLSTYIFGACCPDKDKGCALILPECTTGMMQLHLNEISKQVEKNHHAILIMDRAGWHTTEALIIPKNITLFPLPPYSPELNPSERSARLWFGPATKVPPPIILFRLLGNLTLFNPPPEVVPIFCQVNASAGWSPPRKAVIAPEKLAYLKNNLRSIDKSCD